MKKMINLLMAVLAVLIIAACKPSHHYTGETYIENPDFDMYGGNLTADDEYYYIKSYFMSSVKGQTEFVYENFDMSFPRSYETGILYPLEVNEIEIWFADGGALGELDSYTATGTFKIISASDKKIELEINAEFSSFVELGIWPDTELPESVSRTGILTAREGYELF